MRKEVSEEFKQLLNVLDKRKVFLRAEDQWEGWESFKKSHSFEKIENFHEFSCDLQSSILAGDYDDRYDVKYELKMIFDEDACEKVEKKVPVAMIARGVNALRVTTKKLCREVSFLGMIGYNDDEFVFVFFEGNELGKNVVEDGVIVSPVKLVAVMKPKDVFSSCQKLKKNDDR